MTISRYEILNTVVELGSFTKAAELLNLTQSGVSHGISSLEAEFGFTLLTRDRSGISLTSNGEHILRYVRKVLQWNEQLKQEVAAINGFEIGSLQIGSFTSVSTQWLPEVIKEFQQNHPAIKIKFLEGDYDEISQWISTGRVDFGFLSLPTSKNFEVLPLKKDRMLCIVPKNHPLSGQRTITFDQIEEEPFIMPKWGSDNDIVRVLKENKSIPQIEYEVMEEAAIMAMVQSKLGISILPEMTLFRGSENISTIPLEGDYYRLIGIAASSLKTLSPAAKKFIQCLLEWMERGRLLDY
ncbi:MAG: LysR family transcriptional regulator [Thermotaleaceae bacterium]